ncbi:MAG: bifunctional (p)ppGpp synthetase/guanosine-3',5'-bis(diphosphate) 3'-pyrophosphohydrolase, partial [Alphaproteobacteria bacterium]|nr:bifunctional (p)ppGpp synthetase/guanosine-3',5'-bis(diphosphate) 3'-pyrophosphohydrolase [Alphaproteobacteria bacterium]
MEKNNSWVTSYENCPYSDRLITKLVALNEKAKKKINVLEVKKAIYYAKKYHGAQKRETGEPYYSHPLEVASMVSDYLFRTDILVTSILHDTIEDTDLTFEVIQTEFSPLVANQVVDL